MSAGNTAINSKTSAKARTSLVLGFLSFLIVPGLAAIALGHMGRREIRKSGGRLKGSGLALAGLILGYVGTTAAAIFFTFGFLMLEGDMRAASQAAAVGSLRTLNAALESYSSTYQQGFPRDLAALGPPASGIQKSSQAAGLIDDRLASGLKFRYKFTYVPSHFDEQGFADGYNIHADPVNAGFNAHHYFTDQSGVLRWEAKRPADESSSPLE
jgi:Domain of unknown function (DUF4190)